MTPVLVTVDLEGRLEDLSPAERRIADVILAAPAAASRMSIAELATAAHTSPSTVTRLVHTLGLPGYAHLRLALASESARTHDGEPRGDIGPGDDLASVVTSIAAADVRAVRDTAARLDITTLEHVIDAMAAARRIDVYGVGASGIVAADLQQKLTRIGRIALSFSDVHLGVTSAALMRPGDVAVAISHSGSTADTLDALLVARRAGATCVAVTNRANSPVADAAHHVLLTAARETTFRSGATASRLAQLTVVDCMFVGLAQRTFAESSEALTVTYEAVRRRASQH